VTPDLPAATAIVLAGGRSSRFGRDKLVERLDGVTLLEHAVRAAMEVAGDVVVLIPPVGDEPRFGGRSAAPGRLRIVRDPEPYGGPLVALLAGLERAGESYALVVGGDMPRLAPAVLRLLLRTLDADGDIDATALVLRGRRHPLPVGLRVGSATPVARRVLADGERSLNALLTRLRTRELAEVAWRPLDPTGETLVDVDRPGDLER
jgi:molybdopterin-guanine dinucleotide biosynthesis protein A